MPFMSQSSVIIYFSNPFEPSQPAPLVRGLGEEIQLVESSENQKKIWTLKTPGQPDHILISQESARLLELCSQMTVSAPWRAQAGFDGATSTLTLKGAMSEMTFNWWGDTPKEWHSVGAVFNFVMGILKNLHQGD